MDVDADRLLALALEAAKRAAHDIMVVYTSGDFQTESKDDSSPLTRADKQAHRVISEVLAGSGYPVLSEEGKHTLYAERKSWTYFWMVDPLDGTKEFIKRNGEFTVNIALIHRDKAILGVVAVPVSGDIFYATEGRGAFLLRGGIMKALPKHTPVDLNAEGLRIVASRSHMNEATASFVTRLRNAVLVSAGSSLKFMLIAEGKADLYPRFGPTMEWDTAAAHIIINEIGLKIFRDGSLEELRYNKENLLNPNFLVT